MERIDAKHECFFPPGRAENPLPPAKKRPQTFRAFFFGGMMPFGGRTLFQTDFNQPVIIRMIDQNGTGAFLPKLFKQP